jgi:hypothetical protein
MIKGRRARTLRGSLHRDRPIRWGASVIGVCQVRFARMQHRVQGLHTLHG